MQIGALWQEMYRSQYFEGGRVLQAAISAIDIALHDIKGKALGVPVYELLGGKQRDLIPTFATTRSEAVRRGSDRAGARLDGSMGWDGDPPHPGGPRDRTTIYEPRESIAETAKWCVKAREALGDDVVLGIDYPPPPERRGGRELLPEDAARARSTSSRSRSATRRRRPTRRCAS